MHDKPDREQNQEYVEHNFCNPCRRTCNAAKSQNSGDDGNDQKNDSNT